MLHVFGWSLAVKGFRRRVDCWFLTNDFSVEASKVEKSSMGANTLLPMFHVDCNLAIPPPQPRTQSSLPRPGITSISELPQSSLCVSWVPVLLAQGGNLAATNPIRTSSFDLHILHFCKRALYQSRQQHFINRLSD